MNMQLFFRVRLPSHKPEHRNGWRIRRTTAHCGASRPSTRSRACVRTPVSSSRRATKAGDGGVALAQAARASHSLCLEKVFVFLIIFKWSSLPSLNVISQWCSNFGTILSKRIPSSSLHALSAQSSSTALGSISNAQQGIASVQREKHKVNILIP